MRALTTARLALMPWQDAFGEDLARLAADERRATTPPDESRPVGMRLHGDAAGRTGERVSVYILERPDWRAEMSDKPLPNLAPDQL
jgi:hypothetical protein